MILKLFQDRTRSSGSGDIARSHHHGADSTELTIDILEKITEGIALKSLNVRLWDGTYWPTHEPKPATLVLNRPSALREMLEHGSQIEVAEAYLHEAFDVEGDMIEAFELEEILAAQTKEWTRTLSVFGMLRRLPAFREKKQSARTGLHT